MHPVQLRFTGMVRLKKHAALTDEPEEPLLLWIEYNLNLAVIRVYI